MNEEHLTALFKIKSLLDILKKENTIQPKQYFWWWKYNENLIIVMEIKWIKFFLIKQ